MTRNEAYLTVVEGWLRDNRSIVFTEGSVDDLCDRISAEIEELTGSKAALQTEIERLRAILDGTERREAEYLALIEKGHDEIERLKAERHTTKRMLKDILDKHGYSGWDAARTLTED